MYGFVVFVGLGVIVEEVFDCGVYFGLCGFGGDVCGEGNVVCEFIGVC